LSPDDGCRLLMPAARRQGTPLPMRLRAAEARRRQLYYRRQAVLQSRLPSVQVCSCMPPPPPSMARRAAAAAHISFYASHIDAPVISSIILADINIGFGQYFHIYH